ncbi:uncharacterized protein LOC101760256 [Setaria italica]|uniref:uncharacterized protein LOC101760256 n=1 Tax=Setaria italica TaxID=4555 RepID=UPI000BE592E6|nr:uncharacterized protein LOC101760256 [Setaria italica]
MWVSACKTCEIRPVPVHAPTDIAPSWDAAEDDDDKIGHADARVAQDAPERGEVQFHGPARRRGVLERARRARIPDGLDGDVDANRRAAAASSGGHRARDVHTIGVNASEKITSTPSHRQLCHHPSELWFPSFSYLLMESSDTVPLQSEGVQQGSPRICSTRRTDTCQRLVNRMPINPKLAVFESTQERFEVLLRPELRSSYPVGGGPGSSFQQLPNRNVPQQSYVPDDPGADFIAVDHAPGRNKSVRRMRNAADDRTGVVDRRRKKFRSSHRSSKEKNSAADNSRRLTDYFLAQDGTEAPPRPRNFNVGLDDMTNVPKIRIPRLRDLLARPLGCLTGHPLQAFNELFDQFDQTLSENTCAIQASLCNIARAPYRLAEKCGPVIEELIAAQRSASDPNNIGETSRRNNSGTEDDFVDPHNGGTHRSPQSILIMYFF